MSSANMKPVEKGSLTALSELLANWVDARFSQQPPEVWDIEVDYGRFLREGIPTMQLALRYSDNAEDNSEHRTCKDSLTVTMPVREQSSEQ